MEVAESNERRGDLDALRAFAMLLGVALHASASFYGSVWPVHDLRQGALFPLLFAAVHGFRMPLFFLLSGFFTMLVFRRRGLRTLVRQRSERIALPLVLSMVTILPLCRWIEDRTIPAERREPLVAAVVADDVDAVRTLVVGDAPLEWRDATYRRPLLSWAALAGSARVAEWLLAEGADVNARDPVGSTALHMAAFCGRDGIAAMLVERGADPHATTIGGASPLESLSRSPTLVAAYVRMSGVPEARVEPIAAGRPRVGALLGAAAGKDPGGAGPGAALERVANRYWRVLGSDRFLVDRRDPTSLHLLDTNVLEHLWFLWYLCLLVGAFVACAAAGLSPGGWHPWWCLPLSCVCQAFMEMPHGQLYGPDIAFGVLPPPHLLAYYGCFFFFGAALFARDGTATRFGSRWPVLLPLALLVLLPAGIASLDDRPASILLQPAYAWAMAAGLVGLFRRVVAAPSAAVSWLADASYWIYLAHVPLVIGLQMAVRDWPLPASAKFVLVLGATAVILLASYRWCIRPTVIGRMLNGPRGVTTPPAGTEGGR